MRAMLKVSWSKKEKGVLHGESCWLCPDVKASDVGKSAKLQCEESGVHLRIKLSQQPQDNG